MPTLGTSKSEIKQPILPRIKENKTTQIINLTIHREKLTVLLNDGRELSIPLEWFAKWGVENITANKLKKYEIWRGKNIHFTEINEVLGIEKFTEGFNASC